MFSWGHMERSVIDSNSLLFLHLMTEFLQVRSSLLFRQILHLLLVDSGRKVDTFVQQGVKFSDPNQATLIF